MKYIGKIKNIKEEVIEVIIITNNDSSNTIELTLAGESPIIITQTSPDGIFSPIKSRSCTITIISKDTYFDMYSGNSHGTTVTVNNLTDGECLFFGYLTPCQYNQPYLYLNEIELEAVDAVSTLQDFKYNKGNSGTEIQSVENIIKYCINNVAKYEGGIYVPFLGLKMKSSNYYPFEGEYIAEDAFYNDSGEALSCYEVLEEICKFYNVSLVPFGNDVYFIDYECVSKYGINHSWLTQSNGSDFVNNWKNLNDESIVNLDTNKTIEIDDYSSDSQNIEIDEVYNKVSIKADVNEIEDNDILYDPLEDIGTYQYYTTIEHNDALPARDSFTRFFEINQNETSKWYTKMNVNSREISSNTYELTDNFTNVKNTRREGWQAFPYKHIGHMCNDIVGQYCEVVQQFTYDKNEGKPVTAKWDERIIFFPQPQWLYEYYKQNPWYVDDNTYLPDWDDYYNQHLGGAFPILCYKSNKALQYSPTDANTTNYLLFNGDLLFQQTVKYSDVTWNVWRVAQENAHIYDPCLFPFKELGEQSTHNAFVREPSDELYNKGWNTLKIKLSIGDKYWNGNYWTKTESTAWIPYHKENVHNEDETFIWSDYVKPVTNHDFTSNINKEGFAIPIPRGEYISGELKLEIYMPKFPYSEGIFRGTLSGQYPYYLPSQLVRYAQEIIFDYTLAPSVIFMKDLSLELISAQDSNSTKWYESFDLTKDKDIIYSNEINIDNVKSFDDLELKINTYNEKKPISTSYLLERNVTTSNDYSYHTEGFYRPLTDTTERQEINVVNRYVEHYSTPKKIYNCSVHGYFKPWLCIQPNALDNIRMIIDEQEFDVKADTNELKLIEY